MIYCLTGKLLEKTPDMAVIDCGGVGYQAAIPSTTAGALPAVGEVCTLYTQMNVSENDIALYGFATKDAQVMFRILTSVSGVGPKAGLAILSVMDPARIALAVSGGDHKAFTAANGVGPKLAQRIVLELKDKVGKNLGVSLDLSTPVASGAPASGMAAAAAALTGLGYTGAEAAAALAGLDASLPTAELIRLALQGIGKRR
ncbi:Holliday junction branch migration protein RuvA [uncultured Ruthenibacterium sp.]|uniref:Holliday junction branch migration protein RuvA n=1 Tax=uncultured Ruthenibacterium sp. TaxID=1905347 RepID=UPI00349ED7B4